MAKLTKIMLIGSMALGLTACVEAASRFNSEAGSFLDEGGFGNPTMHNMMVQMCKGRGKGYKLGAVSDPVVVLDPNSSSSAPRYFRDYTARCSDQLNGKYAEIIFREYVNSAVPLPLGGELTQIEAE